MSHRRELVVFVTQLALVLFCGNAALSQDEATAAHVKRLRNTYEEQLRKIEKDHDADTDRLQVRYAEILVRLEKQFLAAGDPESVLAVRREQERFRENNSVPEQALSPGVPDLLVRQNSFRAALDGLALDRAGKIVVLVRQYDRALLRSQESLTRENRIEEALAISQERKALKSRPEVSQAEFVTADAESKQALAAGPPVSEPRPPPSTGDPARVVKKYTGSASDRIRKRFGELCGSVKKQDWDSALEYLDPGFVARAGLERAQNWLYRTFPNISRTADDPRSKVSVDEITVSDDEKTASLVPKVWYRNRWHSTRAAAWVQTEGDWFLSTGEGVAVKPLAPIRPPRDRRMRKHKP